jgi:hypothetical protein
VFYEGIKEFLKIVMAAVVDGWFAAAATTSSSF